MLKGKSEVSNNYINVEKWIENGILQICLEFSFPCFDYTELTCGVIVLFQTPTRFVLNLLIFFQKVLQKIST